MKNKTRNIVTSLFATGLILAFSAFSTNALNLYSANNTCPDELAVVQDCGKKVEKKDCAKKAESAECAKKEKKVANQSKNENK